MKKFLFALGLFLVSTTFIVAQADAPAVQAKAEAVATDKANFEFESDIVDYGTIEQGSDPYRVFTFTNTGEAPGVIKYAKGSCGCTVPTYPKNPILPGETAEVKVRYDTNRVGPFTKRVTLTMDYTDQKTVLTIKGKVNKKAEEPQGVPAKQEKGTFGSGK